MSGGLPGFYLPEIVTCLLNKAPHFFCEHGSYTVCSDGYRHGYSAPCVEPKAAGPAEPAKEAVPEIERLKAENASLLESLQAMRASREVACDTADDERRQRSAAEQRAEAAEKRTTELQGALRELLDSDAIVEMDANVVAEARAALHDEERPAPPEESYGGIDRASGGRFEVPTGLTVAEALELVLRDAALSPDGNTYITLTDTEYRAARAVLVEPHMSGGLEKHSRDHSAECGGQPAGAGCICGVGFDDEERSAPPQEEK